MLFLVFLYCKAAWLPIQNSQTLVHVGNAQVSRGFPAEVIIGRQKAADLLFLRRRQGSVIHDIQIEKSLLLIAPQDHSSPAAGPDAVFDGIFNDRLQNQPRHFILHDGLIQLLDYGEPFAEALGIDV